MFGGMGMDEQQEMEKNADRYVHLRDIKINELIGKRALPCPIDDAYDWFDAQVDAQIKNVYPNATIGGEQIEIDFK